MAKAGFVPMIRLFLVISHFCISASFGIASERIETSCEGLFYAQSTSSCEYDLYDEYNIIEGVIAGTAEKSDYFHDLKRNLFSEYPVINETKSNGFYFTSANLLYLIRKDNLFLSILRI